MSSDEEDAAQLRDELRDLQELLGVSYRAVVPQEVRKMLAAVPCMHTSMCCVPKHLQNRSTPECLDCTCWPAAAAGHPGSAVGYARCAPCCTGTGVGRHQHPT